MSPDRSHSTHTPSLDTQRLPWVRRNGENLLDGALWVSQIVLATLFAIAAVPKLVEPYAEYASHFSWANDLPSVLVRLIGVLELLGAAGLVLPAATRIRPRLTVLAAIGLMMVMAVAACLHFSRGELDMIAVNAGVAGLAGFVAWGRHRGVPIRPRRR